MTLHDPYKAYAPSSNVEAHLVCGALRDAGIDATVIEDVSNTFESGPGPKPQVWINRSDLERARPVLRECDRVLSERRPVEGDTRQVCRSGLSSFGFWSLLVGEAAAIVVALAYLVVAGGDWAGGLAAIIVAMGIVAAMLTRSRFATR
jgi:uncharacterized membrane protein